MSKKPPRHHPTRNPLSRLKMYREPRRKPRLFVWPENRPWTVEEVADYFSVPEETVYKWNKEGKIPYFKAGRHARYDPNDVKAFEERLKQELMDAPDRPRAKNIYGR